MGETASVGVLCWNTALYQQGNNRKPINWEQVEQILDFVEEKIGHGDAVALLQEISYISNDTWKRHAVFGAFCRRFDPGHYDLIYHLSSRSQLLMTVALAPKGLLCRKRTQFDGNRKVTVTLAGVGLTVMAVHAANGQYNRPDLLSLCSAEGSMIAGDFNAGDYAGCGNRDAFQSLLAAGYCDACGGAVTTVYGTAIDHVLVRDLSRVKDLRIHSDVGLSDHFPITFRIVSE